MVSCVKLSGIFGTLIFTDTGPSTGQADNVPILEGLLAVSVE